MKIKNNIWLGCKSLETVTLCTYINGNIRYYFKD